MKSRSFPCGTIMAVTSLGVGIGQHSNPQWFAQDPLAPRKVVGCFDCYMNKLSADRRAAVLRALCEGNGIRATSRLTGANKETVMKVMVEAGEFASTYQDIAHRNLP